MKKIFLALIFSFSFLTVCKAQYKILHNFSSKDGHWPWGSLTLKGSILYGMTETGGTKDDGVIFSINTNGNGYTILLNFN